jgi:hypothetical protein
MESSTKKWLMAIIGIIIVVAMFTGNFDALCEIFSGGGEE